MLNEPLNLLLDHLLGWDEHVLEDLYQFCRAALVIRFHTFIIFTTASCSKGESGKEGGELGEGEMKEGVNTHGLVSSYIEWPYLFPQTNYETESAKLITVWRI